MAYQFFAVHRDEGAAFVTMHRPPANALSFDFVAELDTLLGELEADRSVRAVGFFSAHERIWAAGWDMMSGGGGGGTGSGNPFNPVFNRLEALPVPTVACMKGHALGGGFELALCCDFRLLVDDGRATVGLTETTLGLIPGAGGTQRLPRVVGEAKALELILLGRRILAPEAKAMGLVTDTHAPDAFDAAARAFVADLAARATVALGAAKRAVKARLPLEEGLQAEFQGFLKALQTEDAPEGIQAFFQKRKPNFKGR